MSQTLTDLKALQTLFSDSKRWTGDPRAMAMTADGRRVEYNDQDACQWCFVGGIYLVTGEDRCRTLDLHRELMTTWGGFSRIGALHTLNKEGYTFVKKLIDDTLARVEGITQ